MKNNTSILEIRFLTRFVIAFLLIAFGGLVSGQVSTKVAFKPRVSSLAPGEYKNKSIYNLRGDFTMIGNSNSYKAPYSDAGGNGNNTMKFHKLSGDASDVNIKNSSSADLVLAGLDANCTEIVYAGLYWSGRGNDNDGDSFNGLNKKKVKLKVPGKGYEDVTAVDIFYGGSDVSGMYTGYVDITDRVRAVGKGTYAVANIASREDDGGGTGYYAGWGIVVIYGNPTLPWRNITVFDGFSQIGWDGERENSGWVWEGFSQVRPRKTTYGTLDISGFSAVQNGSVNIKMGMMAGEGDENISGDIFEIRQRNSNNYTRLGHDGNSTSNFFNSSIFTGNNPRVPNYKNNYGTDISMFNLPNTGNALIDNKQTSTRFRFGTTQDLYVIYNIVFAVDAYVPEIEAHNQISTAGLASGGTVTPGQILDFTLDVRNKGTEAINTGKIEIPLPNNVYFVSAEPSIISGSNVQWISPVTNAPSTDYSVPGGTIRWNVGNISLPTNKETILAKLKYKVKVTNNCTVLTTGAGGCGLEIPINGTVTGVGATSTNLVNNTLVKEYGTGNCAGPIYNDFLVTINGVNLNCPDVVNGRKQFKALCGSTEVLRAVVTGQYPVGTKFYRTLSGTTPTNEVTGDFSAPAGGVNKTTYYAVVPGAAAGCYLILETQSTCCDVNIFYEDFKTSPSPTSANDFGRTTSRYMPEGSFTFGTPYPKTDNYYVYAIDNNHYAVVAPGYIKSGHRENQYYFWTPAYTESNTVQDMSNTQDGAVMAINAGKTLKAFYAREAKLEKGATYRASFWMYLVNGDSQVGVDIRDKKTGAIIGTAATEVLGDWDSNKKGKWVQYNFHFKVPTNASCDISDVIVEYRNNKAATQGNDYYIDNISFDKVDPNCAPTTNVVELTCPMVEAKMTFDKVAVNGTFNDANGNGYAEKGETIAYTFRIENTGNVSLSEMKLIDPLFGGEIAWPADLEEYDDKNPDARNNRILYKNGLLDAGEIWFVTKTYTLTNADIRNKSVYNKATVTGKAPNGVSVTKDDDVTVTFKGLSLIITNPMLPSKAR